VQRCREVATTQSQRLVGRQGHEGLCSVADHDTNTRVVSRQLEICAGAEKPRPDFDIEGRIRPADNGCRLLPNESPAVLRKEDCRAQIGPLHLDDASRWLRPGFGLGPGDGRGLFPEHRCRRWRCTVVIDGFDDGRKHAVVTFQARRPISHSLASAYGIGILCVRLSVSGREQRIRQRSEQYCARDIPASGIVTIHEPQDFCTLPTFSVLPV
jgi:hypothetical protein